MDSTSSGDDKRAVVLALVALEKSMCFLNERGELVIFVYGGGAAEEWLCSTIFLLTRQVFYFYFYFFTIFIFYYLFIPTNEAGND